MALMEQEWLGSQTPHGDQDTTVNSSSLSLSSFWGLVANAGIASAIAVIIFLASFLYKHGHVLIAIHYGVTIWQRLLAFIRLFKERESSSQTFNRTRPDKGLITQNGGAELSTPANESQSPSMSNCIYGNFVGEEGVLFTKITNFDLSTPPSAELDTEQSNLDPETLPSKEENVNMIHVRDRSTELMPTANMGYMHGTQPTHLKGTPINMHLP